MSTLVLAGVTYREGIRRKSLIAFLLFGLITLGASIFLTVFSPGEEIKIVKDVCLTGISFFGMLITVFVSGAMIPAEMENRVFYTVISKPLRRATYLMGKFLGAQFLVLINLALMTVLFLVILYTQTKRFTPVTAEGAEFTPEVFGTTVVIVCKAMLLLYCEMAVLSSLTMAVSVHATSATLPVIVGVFIYLVGHLVDNLKSIGVIAGDNVFVATLTQVLYSVLPNLNLFYLRNNLIHNDNYIPQGLLALVLYAGLYVAFGFGLAYFWFRRKEV